MRTTLTAIAFAGVYLLAWVASAQTVELSVKERDLNSFGSDFALFTTSDIGKSGATWKFNQLDCEENKEFTVQIKYSDGSEPDGTKHLVFGDDCDLETADDCDNEIAVSSTTKKLNVSDFITDGECTGTGNTKLWLYYDDDNAGENWTTTPLKIYWDFNPPATPSGLEVGSGNGALFLDWDSDDEVGDEDENDTDTSDSSTGEGEGDGYLVVYWSESDATTQENDSQANSDSTSDSASDSGSDSSSDTASDSDSNSNSDSTSDSASDSTSDSDSDSTSRMFREIWLRAADGDTDTGNNEIACPEGGFADGDAFDPDTHKWKKSTISEYRLGELTNGTVYKVAVATYDEYYNISALSQVVCGRPAETIGFKEILDGSGFDNDGYCFIATAAFGSYNAPTVIKLRAFRDRFLAQMPGGHEIIEAYYEVGPYLAAAIGNNETAKAAVRNGLIAFAVYTQWLLRGAPIPQSVWFALLTALLAVLALGTTRLIYRRIR